MIAYDHIPENTIHTKASVKLVPLDLKVTPNAKVLYVDGSGDEVDEALIQMGYDVESRDLGGLTLTDLAEYQGNRSRYTRI